MKKTLLLLLLSITAVAILFGATILIAKNNQEDKQDDFVLIDVKDLENREDIYFINVDSATQDELYEIIEFVKPEKTVYSMSDVYTLKFDEANGEEYFRQQVKFDSTGMSMTVKNKKTGKTKKYEYSYYYFNLDGEQIKCEDSNFSFNFYTELNTVLTPGEYTAYVNLVTDEGDSLMYPMTFSLIAD